MNVLIIAIAIQENIVRFAKKRYLDTVSLLQIIGDGGFLIQ